MYSLFMSEGPLLILSMWSYSAINNKSVSWLICNEYECWRLEYKYCCELDLKSAPQFKKKSLFCCEWFILCYCCRSTSWSRSQKMWILPKITVMVQQGCADSDTASRVSVGSLHAVERDLDYWMHHLAVSYLA